MQVPYHKTRSSFDFALKKFVRDHDLNDDIITVNNGTIDHIDFERFSYLDDYTLFEEFKKEAKAGDFWGRCLLRAEHLKTVLDTQSNNDENSDAGALFFKTAVKELHTSPEIVEWDDYFVQ